jgi:hypothetical protein
MTVVQKSFIPIAELLRDRIQMNFYPDPGGPSIHIDANLDMLPQSTEILGEIIHGIEFLQKLLERAPFSR